MHELLRKILQWGPQRARGYGGRAECHELFPEALDDGANEVFLGREIVVQCGDVDPGAGGDVTRAQAFEALGGDQLERRFDERTALRLAALRTPARRRARAFGSRGWSGVYGSICMWHDGQPIYVVGAIAGLSACINHLLESI